MHEFAVVANDRLIEAHHLLVAARLACAEAEAHAQVLVHTPDDDAKSKWLAEVHACLPELMVDEGRRRRLRCEHGEQMHGSMHRWSPRYLRRRIFFTLWYDVESSPGHWRRVKR